MEKTIAAIEAALKEAETIDSNIVERTACICHLTEAKRHLENRIKHDDAAQKKKAAESGALPPGTPLGKELEVFVEPPAKAEAVEAKTPVVKSGRGPK